MSGRGLLPGHAGIGAVETLCVSEDIRVCWAEAAAGTLGKWGGGDSVCE